MKRIFLMGLLALNILVMGTSAYIIYDRIQKNLFRPKPIPVPVMPGSLVSAQSQIHSSTETIPNDVPVSGGPKDETLKGTAGSNETGSQKHKLKKVSFRYHDSVPKKVSVVGDFNRWNPQSMKKDKNHYWTMTLKLSPGEYAYNFLVDDKMIRDPSNKKTKKAGQKILSSLLIVR